MISALNPRRTMPTPRITHALKEWQVAIEALNAGKTILLLRKGGIKEAEGKFIVQQRKVILYPTLEHQKPEWLKPDYAPQVIPVASGWHPETITLNSWAEITDIFAVSEATRVEKLLPYHIWNEQFVQERLHWKPRQPLYVLLLRVHRFSPQSILYDPDYGGCRSWISLKESISLDDSVPVLSDEIYGQIVQEIKAWARVLA